MKEIKKMKENLSVFLRTAYSIKEEKDTTTIVEFDKVSLPIEPMDILLEWFILLDIHVHPLTKKEKKALKKKTIYVLFTQSHTIGQKKRILMRVPMADLLRSDESVHRKIKTFNSRKLIEHEGEYQLQVYLSKEDLLTYDLLKEEKELLFSKTLVVG